jgi:hypothetical protein
LILALETSLRSIVESTVLKLNGPGSHFLLTRENNASLAHLII